MERRQELRLKLQNLTLNFKGQLFNVKDISMSGLRLSNFDFRFGVHRAVLFYNKDSTEIIFKIINNDNDGSVGCIILNKEECEPFLKKLFNPKTLSKISPEYKEFECTYSNSLLNTQYSFTIINNNISHLHIKSLYSQNISFSIENNDHKNLPQYLQQDTTLHTLLMCLK